MMMESTIALHCIALRYTEDSIFMDYKYDIRTMQNENPFQLKGIDTNTRYHSSQQQQEHIEGKVEGKYNIDTRSSELCNVSAEYIETITKAQDSLRDYYMSIIRAQLNLLEYLSSAGFTKGDPQELFKQLTISTVEFWINVCTLPWKLALGNVLCIKPLRPFRFSLQQ
jgi:hypothetical protein